MQLQVTSADAALRFAQQDHARCDLFPRTGAGTTQSAQQTESLLVQRTAGLHPTIFPNCDRHVCRTRAAPGHHTRWIAETSFVPLVSGLNSIAVKTEAAATAVPIVIGTAKPMCQSVAK